MLFHASQNHVVIPYVYCCFGWSANYIMLSIGSKICNLIMLILCMTQKLKWMSSISPERMLQCLDMFYQLVTLVLFLSSQTLVVSFVTARFFLGLFYIFIICV